MLVLTLFFFYNSVVHAAIPTSYVLWFPGQKLDDDKQDTIPEVFIDQDEVLKKVSKICPYNVIVHVFSSDFF